MSKLRETMSFGFEQTFTTPDWWADQGFVATSNTPLKLEKMKLLAEKLAEVLGGKYVESQDMYKHVQYECFDAEGKASHIVTMDPGSIEVKSPAMRIHEMDAIMRPLFEAAELAGLVPYRNWWYGIKTGTEGGCHVNMAGFTPETNPLKANPSLVVQYAAFFHNNPWIHFPFMGVDVGPGGNCMRMDEHALDPHAKHAPGTLDSMERFERLAARINAGERPTAEEVERHFKGSKLAEDKHSAPSFYKFKAPAYFIEERAVEALRGAEEFFQVCDLRLRILELLEREGKVEKLREFGPELHREMLGSLWLWNEFKTMGARLEIDVGHYRRYFDRQFPRLISGQDVPRGLEVREGRRPRVITDIQMRGELIISKKIDPTYARLELIWEDDAELVINGRIFPHGEMERDGRQVRCVTLDYRKAEGRMLDLALIADGRQTVLERARFSPKDMMFTQAEFKVDLSALVAMPGAAGGKKYWFNVETDPAFGSPTV